MKESGRPAWFAFVVIVIVGSVLLVGCQGQSASTATAAPAASSGGAAKPSAGAASVEIMGLVAKPVTITTDEMKAKARKLSTEHPKKGPQEYTGMRLSEMLEAAQPKAEAKTLTLVAADGFTADVPMTSVKACADCMLALGDDPIPDAVMPGMDSPSWVRDVTKIEIK